MACVVAAAASVGATRWVAPANAALHDVHVSHTRLVLEGKTIVLRVRLFHDDLQQALRVAAGQPELRLTAEAPAESLFATYFAKRVRLELDGSPVQLRVSGAGLEQDAAAQQVVWYILEGEVAAAPRRLVVLDGLLFETFDDQQNIVQILELPADQRRTLYFTSRDPRPQQLDLGS